MLRSLCWLFNNVLIIIKVLLTKCQVNLFWQRFVFCYKEIALGQRSETFKGTKDEDSSFRCDQLGRFLSGRCFPSGRQLRQDRRREGHFPGHLNQERSQLWPGGSAFGRIQPRTHFLSHLNFEVCGKRL